MNPPRRQEKKRLFAYCLGLTCAEETANVEAWIARHEQATGLHAQIQAALGPLESLPLEPCPEGLAERTVQLLRAATREPPETAHTKTTRTGVRMIGRICGHVG
jgi:anti-sigma factor RsiW